MLVKLHPASPHVHLEPLNDARGGSDRPLGPRVGGEGGGFSSWKCFVSCWRVWTGSAEELL